MRNSVVVAGAGIGGLSLAHCLAEEGVAVQVLERFEEVREVGAGILLGPNASSVLYRRGLGEALERVSAPMTKVGIGSNRGELFVTRELKSEEWPGPFRMIHRAALQATLYDAAQGAPEVEVHLGAAVQGFESVAEQGVRVLRGGGTGLEGVALIGCDGLNSAVRRQLHPAEPAPRYLGYTCWRGITEPFEHPGFEHGALWELQGHGLRVGVSYVDESRVYWWATANAAEGGRDGEDVRAELVARYRDFPDYFLAMVEGTQAAHILRNDIYDRPPRQDWGRGVVTLLGDAAHPMAPNLGQGACSAIEDAALLAARLGEVLKRGGASDEEVSAALRRYEGERVERTAMLQKRSRQLGVVGQWSSAPAVWLREAAMRRAPVSVLEEQQAVIWGYEAG
ncbi:FAD-dependent oxidoreductase [Lujinxingia litoralis]|uniref:FAD-dependent oxidoreductase n=1 Tax=Lujinxingia litoralis TaxID=2211119 RepID=A0A328C508_9DELT|nr:FAD-dependent monooxygenase [Lujinxingia litoralis]RAL22339.1 FAD-dependent oxidoreductase [Lujinxingia litoralis]